MESEKGDAEIDNGDTKFEAVPFGFSRTDRRLIYEELRQTKQTQPIKRLLNKTGSKHYRDRLRYSFEANKKILSKLLTYVCEEKFFENNYELFLVVANLKFIRTLDPKIKNNEKDPNLKYRKEVNMKIDETLENLENSHFLQMDLTNISGIHAQISPILSEVMSEIDDSRKGILNLDEEKAANARTKSAVASQLKQAKDEESVLELTKKTIILGNEQKKISSRLFNLRYDTTKRAYKNLLDYLHELLAAETRARSFLDEIERLRKNVAEYEPKTKKKQKREDKVKKEDR